MQKAARGGDPDRRRGVGAVEPRGRDGGAVRADPRRASCATARGNVYTAPRAHRDRSAEPMAWKGSARIKPPKGTRKRPLGRVQAERRWASRSRTTTRDMAKVVWAEPPAPAVRVAHPAARACATAARSASPASTTGRSSGVHLCTTRLNLLRVNTMRGARPGGARRRRAAAEARRARSCASSAGCRTRWCGGAGERGLHARVVGRGARPDRRPDPRSATPTRSRSTSPPAGITNEVYYVGAEDDAGRSAPTTSTTRRASVTRRRPPR